MHKGMYYSCIIFLDKKNLASISRALVTSMLDYLNAFLNGAALENGPDAAIGAEPGSLSVAWLKGHSHIMKVT